MDGPTAVGRGPARWRTWSPYPAVVVAVLVLAAVPFCLRKPADWDDVFVPAAVRLRAGEFLYQRAFVFPPVNALLAVPFSYLPRLASLFVWYAVSATSFGVLLFGAWRLAGGMRFPGEPGVPRSEHLIAWAGLLCGLSFGFDCLGNRHTDLLVAALLITGCLRLRAGRGVAAAVWFGLAAGLKCTPLLWAPYLAFRRQFRAAAIVPLVAVGINLLPDVLYPPAGGSRLVQWQQVFLAPMAHSDHDPGVWACAINLNHSVAGVFNRWLTTEPIRVNGQTRAVSSPTRVAPATLKLVVYGIDVALVAAAAIVCRRRVLGDASGPVSSDTLEYCLVLLLMVLLSPQSSKPHFCTVMLPAFCLARTALARRDVVLGFAVVLAAVGCQLSNKDLVGGVVYDAVLWYGAVFWTTVLLFLACLHARCSLRTAAAAQPVMTLPVAALKRAA